VKKLPTLRGRLVVNAFFEASTRTLASFSSRKRLSADTMSFRAAGSSVDKGESLKDTILTLSADDPGHRHPPLGDRRPAARRRVDGVRRWSTRRRKHQHPTRRCSTCTRWSGLGRLEGLHVAVVGDVAHSRVARSRQALALVGAHGLVAPPTLLPPGIEGARLRGVDRHRGDRRCGVVYVLRMQRSGWRRARRSSPRCASTPRCTASRRASALGPSASCTGPMNRGVEIDPRVADSDAALVTDQVRSGLVVRMAVLYDVLTVAAPVEVRERAEVV
jgi:aspartate carbamoyltransferase catalytic subunit